MAEDGLLVPAVEAEREEPNNAQGKRVDVPLRNRRDRDEDAAGSHQHSATPREGVKCTLPPSALWPDHLPPETTLRPLNHYLRQQQKGADCHDPQAVRSKALPGEGGVYGLSWADATILKCGSDETGVSLSRGHASTPRQFSVQPGQCDQDAVSALLSEIGSNLVTSDQVPPDDEWTLRDASG
jgi:hypothetical protein